MTNRKKKYFPVIMFVLILVGVVWLFFRPATNESVVKEVPAPKEYKPVVYDVAGWQKGELNTDFEKLKTLIGQTAVESDALDYYGNRAKKYLYTSQSEPPLYVIESDATFELAWYFAHPKDSDKIKATSMEYAKKAYLLATAYFGTDGQTLMQTMLNQKPAEKSITSSHLIFAKCGDYTCQMVIKK